MTSPKASSMHSKKVKIPIIKEDLLKITYEDISNPGVVEQLWNTVYSAAPINKQKEPQLAEIQDGQLKNALYENLAETKK